MKKKEKEFTCEACNETYTMARSDEEAQKEAEELWGDILGENPAIICDDCFQRGIDKIN